MLIIVLNIKLFCSSILYSISSVFIVKQTSEGITIVILYFIDPSVMGYLPGSRGASPV